MSKLRVMGGKRYRPHSIHSSKSEAQRVAEHFRRDGIGARVLKTKNPYRVRGAKVDNWEVYVHVSPRTPFLSSYR